MQHKSWEALAGSNGTALQRAQRLASRGYKVGVTVDETATETTSPLTRETVRGDFELERGSVLWYSDLIQRMVDQGPGGKELTYAEDVSATDDMVNPILLHKEGTVTIFVRQMGE